MDKQQYFFIIFFSILLIFLLNRYFIFNETFINKNIMPKMIDCGLHTNKNDCINSYQCVWNEQPVDNVKTPFCTGNILYLPNVSFDDY